MRRWEEAGPARWSRDLALPSHPSVTLKVQQLAKEQRRCHKEVSNSLGEAGRAGELGAQEPRWRRKDGPAWRTPAQPSPGPAAAGLLRAPPEDRGA